MIGRLRKWRLRRTAKAVSESLKARFGKKSFYCEEEISKVCSEIGLTKSQTKIAFVMFAEESVCDRFLTGTGSSEKARELRLTLGGQIFDRSYLLSYDSLWNRFHDFDNLLAPPRYGSSSSGSWFSGGGDDGDNFDFSSSDGGDGGGDGGD